MASTTAARPRAATAARTPELDLARTVALVTAVVLLVAPGRLPAWVDGAGLDVRSLLPAVVVLVAGAAAALQRSRRRGGAPGWWAVRVGRRLAVLVAAGALLVLVTSGVPSAPRNLLVTDLAGLGMVTVVALALAATSLPTRLLVVVLGVAGAGLAPATWWQLPALLAATGVAVLGSVIGSTVDAAPRGARTVLGLGLAGGLSVAVGTTVAAQVGSSGRWAPATVVTAVGVLLLVLALGQAGTRRAGTDRIVATLAVAGRVALPLWLAAAVLDAWVLATAPVQWLLRRVLWPPLGDDGAVLALALLVGAGLVRLGALLVDRGLALRA